MASGRARNQIMSGNLSCYLVLTGDGDSEEIITVDKSVWSIGRYRGDLSIDDEQISVDHCEIRRLDNELLVVDLNSTNGTFVNGSRVQSAAIYHDDVLSLGNVRFRVVSAARSGLPEARVYSDLLRREMAKQLDKCVLVLDVTYQDGGMDFLEIRSRRFLLGRVSQIGRFSLDDELSRQQCVLVVNDDATVTIQDLGSTNTTRVNRKKVLSDQLIFSDDAIQVGSTELRVFLRMGD